MRILGYVLLIVGILFLVSFAFAQFGGAHLGIHAFSGEFWLESCEIRQRSRTSERGRPADRGHSHFHRGSADVA